MCVTKSPPPELFLRRQPQRILRQQGTERLRSLVRRRVAVHSECDLTRPQLVVSGVRTERRRQARSPSSAASGSGTARHRSDRSSAGCSRHPRWHSYKRLSRLGWVFRGSLPPAPGSLPKAVGDQAYRLLLGLSPTSPRSVGLRASSEPPKTLTNSTAWGPHFPSFFLVQHAMFGELRTQTDF